MHCSSLVDVLVDSGGGGQTGRGQGLAPHQHAEAGLHVTFDPRPGIPGVAKGRPLLEEPVVWKNTAVLIPSMYLVQQY